VTNFSAAHQTLLDSVPAGAGSRVEEEAVSYEHNGTALEGYFAHDAAITDPKPLVLVVHDWAGLQEYPKVRAQMLARLGYAAFAVDIYGADVRPDTMEASAAQAGKFYGDLGLLRARTRAGYDKAVADPRVDASRVVIIGYCFGGSAALELARTGAELSGAVSFHGNLLAHEPSDAGDIAAPLLVLHGAADDHVTDEVVTTWTNEMRAADIDFEIVSYSGAPHAFTLPGIPPYRPKADARSWRRLTDFLDEVFGPAATA
jgi:dienelactone hydrolase